MAKALSVAHGALPLRVILLGSRRERALALSFLAGYRGLAPGAPAVSVAGGTDLPGLLSVLREADLLVSSDTGVAHLGASLGTRLLTLFMGPALCHETAPYSARLLCLQGMAPCGPCVEGPGCREGVCLAAPGPGALAAHVLRALGPCPQGGPDPRPLGGLGSNPLTGSGPAPEASGPALSFESFEGTIAKNAARLIPGGPLGASLNETALTALVFKKAAMAAIFGEDEGEWDPRLDGLGRYRMDGPPPDLDAALGVLRRIARDGLKDKAQRGLFTDHAAGLLYSPDWHAMAGAAPA
jgi:hypothetical protein